jgi:hypothetical protein
MRDKAAGREAMIVQVSVAKPAKRAGTFVIDWDRMPGNWPDIAREVALSLDELARRGAGWSAVKAEGEPEGGR